MRDVLLGDSRELAEVVTELITLHRAMKDRGYQDSIVAAITAGMIALGDARAAANLLTDYLVNARRELRPVPAVPKRLLEELDRAASENSDFKGLLEARALATLSFEASEQIRS
jgi:hypothetical protein